ncbi:AAA family ATPase [Merismopedia glauca]|uniref:AAA family ATPase n=1 Tax=Merismopedia glauca CCAP 1448/3 TaxID=1296344 RepID=A0A2T1C968_9CYAN|nr:AAA family ATPase [Merismopedia glauca]PSB04791.1 AAA family ATPase [Merismopedia glauca CCAP 1448/3]
MSSIAQRLSQERQRRFVGRSAEITLFQGAIATTEFPFVVLHIFGPGGVGKTTLMGQYLQLCQQHQISGIYLDARHLEATSESFLTALKSLLHLEPTDSPVAILGEETGKKVLLIDTYETIAVLDDWLREEFIPQLPENTLIVLAGRLPPSPGWRSDTGWQEIARYLSLRNLSPEESQIYLISRAVPATQHQAVLEFTHGHPLALSLVADVLAQGQEVNFQAEAAPDVVKTLLERFIEDIPSYQQRLALEAFALVRLTTENLLSQMLDLPDVYELFEWLRQLSFTDSGNLGIFPHDLVREVLIADLRWRNPDRYMELHQRSRNYYMKLLDQAQGVEQQRVLFDYIFLHRDNPSVRPRFTWQQDRGLSTQPMQQTDITAILSMLATHEGEESAKIAAHWVSRQPQNFWVFRGTDGSIAGFICLLALNLAITDDFKIDPGAIAAYRYLQNHAPLRSGEGATMFRFWMAKDTYQEVSSVQSLIFITFVQHYRTTANLAFTFLPCSDPEYWAEMFAYADLTRLPQADFEVGGRRWGTYGHDWRVVSPTAWQELLAQREIAASAQAIQPQQVSEPLLVLSQAEFIQAVQDALRHYTRSEELLHNPLLRSRLVLEQLSAKATTKEKIAVLQNLLKTTAESWRSNPREEKLYRAIYRTYLQPAPTQEQAAELLDLPFSTYRRHLKSGIDKLAMSLWQREIS